MCVYACAGGSVVVYERGVGLQQGGGGQQQKICRPRDTYETPKHNSTLVLIPT